MPLAKESAAAGSLSVSLHGGIDAACPGVDTSRQIDGILGTVLTHPRRDLGAADAMVANDDEGAVARKILDTLHKIAHGNG